MELDLVAANAVIAQALALGAERRLAPLAVCVLDAGGHLISAQRQDGCSILRFEIAQGKAYAALGVGRSTRFAQEVMAVQRPGFVEALSVAAHGKFIPVAGGLLVRGRDARILGAVGVTGDTADNDEAIARDALSEIGLSTDPP